MRLCLVYETSFNCGSVRIQSPLPSITDLVMTFISALASRREVSLFASSRRTLVRKQPMEYHCSIELGLSGSLSLSALTRNSKTLSKEKAFVSCLSTDGAEASNSPTVKLTFRSRIRLVISVAPNGSLSRLTTFWFFFFSNSFSSTDRFSSMVPSLFFFPYDSSFVTSSIFLSVIACSCFESKTSSVTGFQFLKRAFLGTAYFSSFSICRLRICRTGSKDFDQADVITSARAAATIACRLVPTGCVTVIQLSSSSSDKKRSAGSSPILMVWMSAGSKAGYRNFSASVTLSRPHFSFLINTARTPGR